MSFTSKETPAWDSRACYISGSMSKHVEYALVCYETHRQTFCSYRERCDAGTSVQRVIGGHGVV
jgi:hypothetical protein